MLIEVYLKPPIIIAFCAIFHSCTIITLHIWLFYFWYSKIFSYTFIINCSFYHYFSFVTLNFMFYIILLVVPYFVYFCLKSICPSLYLEMLYISWLKYVSEKLWSSFVYILCSSQLEIHPWLWPWIILDTKEELFS